MTIKQLPGTGMCAVCVAAMATKTTVEDVYAFFADGREIGDPIHDPELAVYLLRHGLIMGRGWQVNPEDGGGRPIDNPDNLHLILEGLVGTPAYLAVESKNYPGVGHAVFWDGQCVRDPDPKVPDETHISEYVILQCYPLTITGSIDLVERIRMDPRDKPPYFVKRYREIGPIPRMAPTEPNAEEASSTEGREE